MGDINTISMKIYDSAGPSGIKRVEFALGVPDIGLYHEAEAFVEVWMQRDSVAVQETIIVDELNLLEDLMYLRLFHKLHALVVNNSAC